VVVEEVIRAGKASPVESERRGADETGVVGTGGRGLEERGVGEAGMAGNGSEVEDDEEEEEEEEGGGICGGMALWRTAEETRSV